MTKLSFQFILSMILVICLQISALSGRAGAADKVMENNSEILVSDLTGYVEQAKAQKFADESFIAGIEDILNSAESECPLDFPRFVRRLGDYAAEFDKTRAGLESLKKHQAVVAKQYSIADSGGETGRAGELLAELRELNILINEAESAVGEVHELRFDMFVGIFDRFTGIDCPDDMVMLDGTFCIDRYEAPNKCGAKPMEGLSYEDAESYCEQQGKRLCSVAEWERACRGPDCRLNFMEMKPFSGAACRAGLDVQPDLRPAVSGTLESCETPEGIADLFGNMWEWVDGDYKKYYKYIYGGAGTREKSAYCSKKMWAKPGERKVFFGARCCSIPSAKGGDGSKIDFHSASTR